MDKIDSLRAELDRLLSGQGAHVDFSAAIAGLPAKLRGVRPEGSPHSVWEVIEHLRIAQRDMLEFSRDATHASPAWPEGYWPKSAEPESAAAWDRSVQSFHLDLQAMRDLVANPKSDLFAPFPHGDGQTLLREALQLADHNAYHVGELICLRRQLGAWK